LKNAAKNLYFYLSRHKSEPMNPIFKKLNYKNQQQLHIVNAPASFKNDMNDMAGLAAIKTSLASTKTVEFFLDFVTRQVEVNNLAPKVAALLAHDAVFWLAYPKGTSKKYTCDFNRDTGWTELTKLGFETVRMVAIDDDWSAMRFRKVEFIKTMVRSFAITDTGKKKVAATKRAKAANKK
jgi:hypothetical protein